MKMGQHREGLNEKIEGSGIITFDLKDGLSILWEAFYGKGNFTKTKFDS